MIFTKDLMRSTKVIFIGDVYVAVALRGLMRKTAQREVTNSNLALDCAVLISPPIQ